MRIGLLSDTHLTKRGQLWPQVLDAFDGVDAILHAGDLWSLQLVDELKEIAPVQVVRGNGDMGLEHEHLHERYTAAVDGVQIAMIHDFPSPAWRSEDVVLQRAAQRFPQAAPDVIVYGHTHIEEIHRVDGLLCVNPGSPTLPHNKSLRLGTIGFLNVENGHVDAELWQLTDTGAARVS